MATSRSTGYLVTAAIWNALFTKIDDNGTLNSPLVFPAVQSASTNANTLDDYEEGTWTPVIGAHTATSGQTYGTQTGLYVKIGQLIVAQFIASLTAKGTLTGNVQIQGLPFTTHATDARGSYALQFGGMATNWIYITAAVDANATTAGVRGSAAAAAALSTVVAADISDTTELRGAIIYRASA